MPENVKFLEAVSRLRFPKGRVSVFFEAFFQNIDIQNGQNGVLLGSPILPILDSAIKFEIDSEFLKDFVAPIPNIDELVYIMGDAPAILKDKFNELLNYKIQQLKANGQSQEQISQYIKALPDEHLERMINTCIQSDSRHFDENTKSLLYTALYTLIQKIMNGQISPADKLNKLLSIIKVSRSEILDDFEKYSEGTKNIFHLLEPLREQNPIFLSQLFNNLHCGFSSRRDYVEQLKSHVISDFFFLRNTAELNDYNDESSNQILKKLAVEKNFNDEKFEPPELGEDIPKNSPDLKSFLGNDTNKNISEQDKLYLLKYKQIKGKIYDKVVAVAEAEAKTTTKNKTQPTPIPAPLDTANTPFVEKKDDTYHITFFFVDEKKLITLENNLKKQPNFQGLFISTAIKGLGADCAALSSITATGKTYDEIRQSFDEKFEEFFKAYQKKINEEYTISVTNTTGKTVTAKGTSDLLFRGYFADLKKKQPSQSWNVDKPDEKEFDQFKTFLHQGFEASFAKLIASPPQTIEQIAKTPENKLLIHQLLALVEIKHILPKLAGTNQDGESLIKSDLTSLDNFYEDLQKPALIKPLSELKNRLYKFLGQFEIKENSSVYQKKNHTIISRISPIEIKLLRPILDKAEKIKLSNEIRSTKTQAIETCFSEMSSPTSTNDPALGLATLIQSEHREADSSRIDPEKNKIANYLYTTNTIQRIIQKTSQGKHLLSRDEQETIFNLTENIKNYLLQTSNPKLTPEEFTQCHYKIQRNSKKVKVYSGDKTKTIQLNTPLKLPFALIKSKGSDRISLSMGGSRYNIAPLKDLDNLRYDQDSSSEKKTKERLFSNCLTLGSGQYGDAKLCIDCETGITHVVKQVYTATPENLSPSAFSQKAIQNPFLSSLTRKFDNPEVEIWVNKELEKKRLGLVGSSQHHPLSTTSTQKNVPVITNKMDNIGINVTPPTSEPEFYSTRTFNVVKMDQVLAPGVPLKTYNDKQHGVWSSQSKEFHDPIQRLNDPSQIIQESIQMGKLGCGIIKAAQDLKGMGFTHNDIKPENLLFKGDEVRFIDFNTAGFQSTGTLNAAPKTIETAAKILGCEVNKLEDDQTQNLHFIHADGRYVQFGDNDEYAYGRNPVLDILPYRGKKQGTLSYLYDVTKLNKDSNDHTILDASNEVLDNWALMTMIFGVCNKDSYFALSERPKLTPYIIPEVIEIDPDAQHPKLKPGDKFNNFFAVKDQPTLMYIPSTNTEGEPLHLYKRLLHIKELLSSSSEAQQEKEIVSRIESILNNISGKVSGKETYNKDALLNMTQEALGIVQQYAQMQDPSYQQKLAKSAQFDFVCNKQTFEPTHQETDALKDLEILCLYPQNQSQIERAIEKLKAHPSSMTAIYTNTVFEELLPQILIHHQSEIFQHIIQEWPSEHQNKLQKLSENHLLLNMCLEQNIDIGPMLNKTYITKPCLDKIIEGSKPYLQSTYTLLELAVITDQSTIFSKDISNIDDDMLQSPLKLAAERHNITLFEILYEKLRKKDTYKIPYKDLFETDKSLELFNAGHCLADKKPQQDLFNLALHAAESHNYSGLNFLIQSSTSINWLLESPENKKGLLYHVLSAPDAPEKLCEFIDAIKEPPLNDFLHQELSKTHPYNPLGALRHSHDNFNNTCQTIFNNLSPKSYQTFIGHFCAYANMYFKGQCKETGEKLIEQIIAKTDLDADIKIDLLTRLQTVHELEEICKTTIRGLTPTQFKKTDTAIIFAEQAHLKQKIELIETLEHAKDQLLSHLENINQSSLESRIALIEEQNKNESYTIKLNQLIEDIAKISNSNSKHMTTILSSISDALILCTHSSDRSPVLSNIIDALNTVMTKITNDIELKLSEKFAEDFQKAFDKYEQYKETIKKNLTEKAEKISQLTLKIRNLEGQREDQEKKIVELTSFLEKNNNENKILIENIDKLQVIINNLQTTHTTEIEKKEKIIEEQQNNLQLLEAELLKNNNQNVELQNDLNLTNKSIADLNNQLFLSTTEIEKVSNENLSLKQELQKKEENHEHLLKNFDELKATNDSLLEDQKLLQQKISENELSYNNLNDELKISRERSIKRSRQLNTAQKELSELQNILNQSQNDNDSINRELSGLKNKLEENKDNIRELNKKIKQLQGEESKEIHKLNAAHQALSDENNALVTQIKSYEETINGLTKTNSELAEEINVVKKQNEELNAKLDDQTRLQDQLLSQANALKEKNIELDNASEKNLELQEAITLKANDILLLNSEIVTLDNQNKNLIIELDENKVKIRDLTQKLHTLETQKNTEHETEINTLQTQIQTLKENNHRIQEEIHQNGIVNDELRSKLESASKNNDVLNAKILTIEEENTHFKSNIEDLNRQILALEAKLIQQNTDLTEQEKERLRDLENENALLRQQLSETYNAYKEPNLASSKNEAREEFLNDGDNPFQTLIDEFNKQCDEIISPDNSRKLSKDESQEELQELENSDRQNNPQSFMLQQLTLKMAEILKHLDEKTGLLKDAEGQIADLNAFKNDTIIQPLQTLFTKLSLLVSDTETLENHSPEELLTQLNNLIDKLQSEHETAIQKIQALHGLHAQELTNKNEAFQKENTSLGNEIYLLNQTLDEIFNLLSNKGNTDAVLKVAHRLADVNLEASTSQNKLSTLKENIQLLLEICHQVEQKNTEKENAILKLNAQINHAESISKENSESKEKLIQSEILLKNQEEKITALTQKIDSNTQSYQLTLETLEKDYANKIESLSLDHKSSTETVTERLKQEYLASVKKITDKYDVQKLDFLINLGWQKFHNKVLENDLKALQIDLSETKTLNAQESQQTKAYLNSLVRQNDIQRSQLSEQSRLIDQYKSDMYQLSARNNYLEHCHIQLIDINNRLDHAFNQAHQNSIHANATIHHLSYNINELLKERVRLSTTIYQLENANFSFSQENQRLGNICSHQEAIIRGKISQINIDGNVIKNQHQRIFDLEAKLLESKHTKTEFNKLIYENLLLALDTQNEEKINKALSTYISTTTRQILTIQGDIAAINPNTNSSFQELKEHVLALGYLVKEISKLQENFRQIQQLNGNRLSHQYHKLEKLLETINDKKESLEPFIVDFNTQLNNQLKSGNSTPVTTTDESSLSSSSVHSSSDNTPLSPSYSSFTSADNIALLNLAWQLNKDSKEYQKIILNSAQQIAESMETNAMNNTDTFEKELNDLKHFVHRLGFIDVSSDMSDTNSNSSDDSFDFDSSITSLQSTIEALENKLLLGLIDKGEISTENISLQQLCMLDSSKKDFFVAALNQNFLSILSKLTEYPKYIEQFIQKVHELTNDSEIWLQLFANALINNIDDLDSGSEIIAAELFLMNCAEKNIKLPVTIYQLYFNKLFDLGLDIPKDLISNYFKILTDEDRNKPNYLSYFLNIILNSDTKNLPIGTPKIYLNNDSMDILLKYNADEILTALPFLDLNTNQISDEKILVFKQKMLEYALANPNDYPRDLLKLWRNLPNASPVSQTVGNKEGIDNLFNSAIQAKFFQVALNNYKKFDTELAKALSAYNVLFPDNAIPLNQLEQYVLNWVDEIKECMNNFIDHVLSDDASDEEVTFLHQNQAKLNSLYGLTLTGNKQQLLDQKFQQVSQANQGEFDEFDENDNLSDISDLTNDASHQLPNNSTASFRNSLQDLRGRTPSHQAGDHFSVSGDISTITPQNDRHYPSETIYAHQEAPASNLIEPTKYDEPGEVIDDQTKLGKLHSPEGLTVYAPTSKQAYQLRKDPDQIHATIQDRHFNNDKALALTIMNMIENVLSQGSTVSINTNNVFTAKIADLYVHFLIENAKLPIEYTPATILTTPSSNQALENSAISIFTNLTSEMGLESRLSETDHKIPWLEAAQSVSLSNRYSQRI